MAVPCLRLWSCMISFAREHLMRMGTSPLSAPAGVLLVVVHSFSSVKIEHVELSV